MLEKLPEAIGHALIHQRAGMEKILYHSAAAPGENAHIEITSPAFAAGATLPRRFTADGDGISPPLRWRKLPANTAALALIVEDADSPTPEPLVHGIVVDIDPGEVGLEEGAFSARSGTVTEKLGRNSFLTVGWLAPDPPPGHGAHRYAFQLFALTEGAPLSGTPGRAEVVSAIQERAVGRGCLIGTYQREAPVKTPEAETTVIAEESALTPPAFTV